MTLSGFHGEHAVGLVVAQRALGLLLSVALLSALLRDALSSFVAPPLPCEPISPL